MSTNKQKYFRVTGTFLVRANNKGDAEMAVRRARVPHAEVLGADVVVDRITAKETNTILAEQAL